MDPVAAIHDYMEAVADDDMETAHSVLLALDVWLGSGGFAPRDWHLRLVPPPRMRMHHRVVKAWFAVYARMQLREQEARDGAPPKIV